MRAAIVQSTKHLIWVRVGADITTKTPTAPITTAQGWVVAGNDITTTGNLIPRGPWKKSGNDITT